MQRPPRTPRLQRFASLLWATGPGAPAHAAPREHVLPTGAMHLVFRLSGPSLRVFRDHADECGDTHGWAVVGGARAAFYARDVTVPTRSVGALLRPGTAMALFGVPADALAGRHTPLDALWGADAALALEQLHAAATPARQLAVLEALLVQRIELRFAQGFAHAAPMHPAVVAALPALARGTDVRTIVRASGLSHRHLIARVREATGLAPKTYARVLRFQRALGRMEREPAVPWAVLALDAGYSDQAHFSREFAAIAGVAPQAWKRAAPPSANHVPVPR